MPTQTISPTDSLWTAVHDAADGDTIELQAGTYLGGLSLYRQPKKVTLQPAPGAEGKVVVEGVSLDQSSGVRLHGLEITPASNTWCVTMSYGSEHEVTGCNLHGGPDSVRGAFSGNGVMVRNCTDTDIVGNHIHNVGVAVAHLNGLRLKINKNHIHELQGDAITGGTGTDEPSHFDTLDISENTIYDMFFTEGEHPDGIQLYTAGATTAAGNVTIRNNDIRRRDGLPFQGIFIGNNSGIPYYGFVIEGNLVMSGMWHGITLDHGVGGKLNNNFTQGDGSLAVDGQKMACWLNLRDCTNSEAKGNTCSSLFESSTVGAPSTNTLSDNTTIPEAAPGDYAAADAWLAARGTPVPAPDPTLDNLKSGVLGLEVAISDFKTATLLLGKATSSLKDALAAFKAAHP